MRRVAIAVALALLFLASAAADEASPQSSAETWLALVDQGQYNESWSAASAYFRGAVTEDRWVQAVTAARVPPGSLITRIFEDATHRTTIPGAPAGEYEVIRYLSRFTNKAVAVETVTVMRDGDSWKVAGYFIR